MGKFARQTPPGIFYGHTVIMPGNLTQVEVPEKHGFVIAFQINTDRGLGQLASRLCAARNQSFCIFFELV